MPDPEMSNIETIAIARRSQSHLRAQSLALAGGRCAFPDCEWHTKPGENHVLEIAHIHAVRPDGPRYEPGTTHGLENLIVLCASHHRIVDRDPETYTAGRLAEMRARTVRTVAAAMSSTFAAASSSSPMSVPDLLAHWRANRGNSSEEHWQQIIGDNPIVVAAVTYGRPFVLHGKCYVGGKSFNNQGGNVLDFVAAHQYNCTLVEIKTPTADLVGARYRNNTYLPGKDVLGGVLQVLESRRSLLESVATLNLNTPVNRQLAASDPLCVVIVGDLAGARLDTTQATSFELFRGGQHNVEVVTFDEVFQALETFAQAMEPLMP
ncbi:Shedu anti-phage system protein SduA domain-containing protein [Marmoricola sp. RAF53]|uniref:Shedu anti-phage system protein SduA domain-containing protein n=1 Tax=Marmoricola sp. RAF53 TaxID=3233059 RepID=UPI003F9D4A15